MSNPFIQESLELSSGELHYCYCLSIGIVIVIVWRVRYICLKVNFQTESWAFTLTRLPCMTLRRDCMVAKKFNIGHIRRIVPDIDNEKVFVKEIRKVSKLLLLLEMGLDSFWMILLQYCCYCLFTFCWRHHSFRECKSKKEKILKTRSNKQISKSKEEN